MNGLPAWLPLERAALPWSSTRFFMVLTRYRAPAETGTRADGVRRVLEQFLPVRKAERVPGMSHANQATFPTVSVLCKNPAAPCVINRMTNFTRKACEICAVFSTGLYL